MQQELTVRVDDKKARAIIERVNRADPSRADMEAFRALVAEKPRQYTEMGRICLDARQIYLDTMNGVEREAIRLRLEEVEGELRKPGDGAMEELLISHVVLCWLRLMMIERQYTHFMNQSITLTLGVYWEKRLNAAQKRFIRSVENLARVRKLMRRPAMSGAVVGALLGTFNK